jgi:IS30 family transposase
MQHPTTGGIPMPVPINRPRPGRGAPLTAERELYLRLVTQGMSNIEACRKVGIHRITGVRWRDGRTMVDSGGRTRHYAPITTHPNSISARFLSEKERVRIGDLRQAGHSIRAVAEDLGRSPSTISREIRRNRDADGKYRPFTAQRATAGRRARPRPGKLARDPVLAAFVQDRLEQRWSPEQISAALPGEFPDDPERHVVHETIYQALYVQGRGRLRRELVTKLRTGRARRKPHRRPDGRRQGCFVDPDVLISQRPAEVADRSSRALGG